MLSTTHRPNIVLGEELSIPGMDTLDIIDTKDEEYHGLYQGKVVDVDDPDRRGRIRVRVAGLFDEIATESIPWASPRNSYVGSVAGSFIVPVLDSKVHVEFEQGDVYSPLYSTKPALDYNQRVIVPGINDDQSNYPNTQLLFQTDEGDFLKVNNIDHSMTFVHNSGAIVYIDEQGNITINNDSQVSEGNITIACQRDVNINSQGNVNINSDSHVTVNGTTLSLNASTLLAINGNTAINGNLFVSKEFYGNHQHIANMGMPSGTPIANGATFPQAWTDYDPKGENDDRPQSEATETKEDAIEAVVATGEPDGEIEKIEDIRSEIATEVQKFDSLKMMLFLRSFVFADIDKYKDDKSSMAQLIVNHKVDDLIAKVDAQAEKIKELNEKYEKNNNFRLYSNEPIPNDRVYLLKAKGQRKKKDGTAMTMYEFAERKEAGIISVGTEMLIFPQMLIKNGNVQLFLQFDLPTGDKCYLMQEIWAGKDKEDDTYSKFATADEFKQVADKYKDIATTTFPKNSETIGVFNDLDAG